MMHQAGHRQAVFFFILFLVLAIFFGIQIWICSFLSSCLSRLPEPFRKQKPGLVWLLLIPCFDIVWVFFVYPQIADSFRSYFAARGKNNVGDCGAGLALALCICFAASMVLCFVPFIGRLGGLATLVLLILVLVEFSSLKAQVSSDPVSPASAPPGAFCPNCGSRVSPEVKFCPVCGSPVAASQSAGSFCPACGAKQVRGAKFCSLCGKSLP
jgi:DNA-directed RNA polymerase subunit RPC12/RpoP